MAAEAQRKVLTALNEGWHILAVLVNYFQSSDESNEGSTQVQRPKSGVRGFAKRRKISAPIKEQPVKSGFYSGIVTNCFNQIKTHSLVDEMKYAWEDEEDVECDLLPKCSRKTPPVSSVPIEIVSDEEEDEKGCDARTTPEKNINANAIRSPTPPPPPPPVGQRKKRTRPTKQKKSLLNAVNKLTKSLSEAQEELKKSQLLQSPEPEICIVDVQDEVTVRVDHRGNLLRYSVSLEEPFSKIIMQIAEKEDVLENRVMLVHKDKTLKPYDTPASVGLQIADILECHIVSNLEDSLNETCDREDPNIIELVIQSKERKNKEQIKAHIKRPVSSIINEYAQRLGKDPACIQFVFDGVILECTDTPEALDLEDGDIIDMKEVKPHLMDGTLNSKKARMSECDYSEIIHID